MLYHCKKYRPTSFSFISKTGTDENVSFYQLHIQLIEFLCFSSMQFQYVNMNKTPVLNLQISNDRITSLLVMIISRLTT